MGCIDYCYDHSHFRQRVCSATIHARILPAFSSTGDSLDRCKLRFTMAGNKQHRAEKHPAYSAYHIIRKPYCLLESGHYALMERCGGRHQCHRPV